jgi:hypothetical protein
MFHSVIKRLITALLVGCACVTALAVANADPDISIAPAGKVRFYNVADSDFDIYSRRPDEISKEWMRTNFLRM